MYEYKNMPPRELGPGSYGISLQDALEVKQPDRLSYAFLSPMRKSNSMKGTGVHGDSDGDGDGAGEGGAPTSFASKQALIRGILSKYAPKAAGNVTHDHRVMSPFDRLALGKHASTPRRRAGHRAMMGRSRSFHLSQPKPWAFGLHCCRQRRRW